MHWEAQLSEIADYFSLRVGFETQNQDVSPWSDISIQMGAVTPLHASAWESPRKLMFPLSHRWRGKQICGFRMVRNHWMCDLFDWRCSIESMVFALNLCSRSWSILPSVMLVVCWGVGKSVGTYTRKPHLPAPAYSSWTRVTKHIFLRDEMDIVIMLAIMIETHSLGSSALDLTIPSSHWWLDH